MKAWVLFTLIGSIRAGMVANTQEVTLLFADPTLKEPVRMNVAVDTREETIHYHMKEEGNMGDVETLEDYATGFAASRDAEEEGCFLRRLGTTMEDAIDRLQKTSAAGAQQYSGSHELMAVPSDDLREVAGDRLADFCGEYEMYKLVMEENEINLADNEEGEERFFFWFRRCRCFFFFFNCFRIVITVPTGVTLFFPFFFGLPFWG